MSTTLKLFLNTSTKKVFLVEAEKDYIDSLFDLLTMKLGSIVKALTPSLMVGCVGNLYHSVEEIDDRYVVAKKAALLDPDNSDNDDRDPFMEPSIKYYLCLSCESRIARARDIICPCGGSTERGLDFIVPPWSLVSSSHGYVTEFAKYTITDDFHVTPMSAVSILNLMSSYNCWNDTQWELKEVIVGTKEATALIEASLKSCTVFSDVFLAEQDKDSVQKLADQDKDSVQKLVNGRWWTRLGIRWPQRWWTRLGIRWPAAWEKVEVGERKDL